VNIQKIYQSLHTAGQNGLGTTKPNGRSVIVYEGKIIGEGWHKKAGEPHAEVNAVSSKR
jgi:diaminohydroxyphosphoribosylaminopyrimidine deaminase/5-amino-6-(5-phosphoribosylamino)uracil reductase